MELGNILLLIQKASGSKEVPRVAAAKEWLRNQGAGSAASTLGKLSSVRNVHAHAAAGRVSAAVEAIMAGDQPESDAGRLQSGSTCTVKVQTGSTCQRSLGVQTGSTAQGALRVQTGSTVTSQGALPISSGSGSSGHGVLLLTNA